VNALPVVGANASQTLICNEATVSVSGNGANTYTWTNGISNNTAFSPSNTATYSVIGTDLNGCENNAAITISVNPLPILTVASTNTFPCIAETITLTVGGANSYTWNSGEQTASIVVTLSASTSFTVYGTGANTCTNDVVYQQLIDACAGIVKVDSSYKDVSCRDKNDGEIILSPQISYSPNVIYYAWSPPELCPDSNCTVLKNLKQGDYSVRITIHYTLTPTFSKTEVQQKNFRISDNQPPCPTNVFNGLTLNQDGTNDVFYIENIDAYPNNKVMIFNRWGKKMAEIDHYNNKDKAWPLTSEDFSEIMSSTYYYVIDLGDGSKASRGWIEVLKN
jgi:gliding motility-associated-like protein